MLQNACLTPALPTHKHTQLKLCFVLGEGAPSERKIFLEVSMVWREAPGGRLQTPTRVMSVCLRKGGGVLSLSKKDPWVAVNTEYAMQTGLKVIDHQKAEKLTGGKP